MEKSYHGRRYLGDNCILNHENKDSKNGPGTKYNAIRLDSAVLSEYNFQNQGSIMKNRTEQLLKKMIREEISNSEIEQKIDEWLKNPKTRRDAITVYRELLNNPDGNRSYRAALMASVFQPILF